MSTRTSLRRSVAIPTLIVHRILKWALEHPDTAAPSFIKPAVGTEATLYSTGHLEEIASETSETERRAATAERELIDWKTAQYMEQRLGDEFDALIISVQKYGCFVELLDIFVEGLLPISALEEAADTRCVLREHDHAIVAVSGNESGRRARGSRRKPPAPARLETRRSHPRPRRTHRPHAPPRRIRPGPESVVADPGVRDRLFFHAGSSAVAHPVNGTPRAPTLLRLLQTG